MGATQIRLTQNDGWWVAKDMASGVTSQGRTREDALDNLDEAIAGYEGAGEEPTDEELRELGIDPANNESSSLEESAVFE